MRPALLFDRDGTLNVNHGWVHRPDQFEWIEGAIDAIKWANDHDYLAIVITNQAGIAKGLYDEATFHRLSAWMQDELAAHGAHLDAIYFCPHHPDGLGELARDCECRKPKPGMILTAQRELGFDPSRSLLVGDMDRDLEAATRAGIRSVRYEGGSLLALVRAALEGSETQTS